MTAATTAPKAAAAYAATRFYHGTGAEFKPGDLIHPHRAQAAGEDSAAAGHVYLTPDLDAAIWEGQIADPEGPGRVYIVEPTGEVLDASDLPDRGSPGHPWMSWYSREPLRVICEVTEWPLYHGTRADLKPGDLILPGFNSNYGKRTRASYVYLTRTLDAAAWGAELAAGEGPGRIYVVEPTGPIEDDPNLTNMRYLGNPTKSFRSREPPRVVGEVAHWQGHSPEAIKRMKDGLEQLARVGVEAIDG